MQITYLQLWFDRLDSFLPNVPKEIWLAVFFLPVVLALFSRRTVVFLGSVLTAGIALFVILKPSSITLIVAAGAYAGSLLVAIFGIQTRRKNSAVHTNLMRLQSQLNTLKNAEEQRFFAELKERGKTLEDENR
jgi:ABC-type transport system involved in multi-copper enzyme maturation permease subunit